MNFQYQSSEMYAADPESILDYEVEYFVDKDGCLELRRIVDNETGKEVPDEDIPVEIWKMIEEQAEREFWQKEKAWCY